MTMLVRELAFPVFVGKTRPSLDFEVNFHSRSPFATYEISGTVRCPAPDFGFPMLL